MIRIALIDSHRLFRVSLRSLINSFEGCEVAFDLSRLGAVSPKEYDLDVIIVDPYTATVEIAYLKDVFSSAKLVVLTESINVGNLNEMSNYGVSAFFSKDGCPKKLNQVIYRISHDLGGPTMIIGDSVRERLMEMEHEHLAVLECFTQREIEILQLVCEEKTNIEISRILGLSVRTIESHRRRMIEKVDCKNIIGVILKVLNVKPLGDTQFYINHKAS